MSSNSQPTDQQTSSGLPTSTHNLASQYQADQNLTRVSFPLTYQQALGNVKRLASVDGSLFKPLLDELATREKTLGDNHPEIVDTLRSLAERCKCLAEFESAEALSKRALEICEHCHGKDHQEVGNQLSYCAEYLMRQAKYKEAEPYYQRLIDIYKKLLAPENITIASVKHLLAVCYGKREKYNEAEALSKKALSIFVKVHGEYHLEVGKHQNNLALYCRNQHKYEEAAKYYQGARDIYKRHLPPDNVNIAMVEQGLHFCLDQQNNENKKAAKPQETEQGKTAHKRTSDSIDVDVKSTLQGPVAAKTAKFENTVVPRATSSAALDVASTSRPAFSSDETAPEVPEQSHSLERLEIIAEFSRKLNDQIAMEIDTNAHLKCKQRINELQAEIGKFECSQSKLEKIIAGLETKLLEKAQQLSSSEVKNKNLGSLYQKTVAKSARLEDEINDKAQLLSEAVASIEDLKTEIAEKSKKLDEAERIIEDHLCCSACKDEYVNRVWSECRHVATCEKCASKLLRNGKGKSGEGIPCPICQTLGFPWKVYV